MQKIRNFLHRKLHTLIFYKQKAHIIKCTLTKAEYKLLLKQAEKAGRKPARYLKEAALAYMEKKYLVPADTEERLLKVIVGIRHIGNNLNQIAEKVNTVKKATIFDLVKTKRKLRELECIIESFVKNPQVDDNKIHGKKDGKLQTASNVSQQAGENRHGDFA